MRLDFQQSQFEYLKQAYGACTDDDGIGFNWHIVNFGFHYC